LFFITFFTDYYLWKNNRGELQLSIEYPTAYLCGFAITSKNFIEIADEFVIFL
jgi:hypothetical protein